MTRYPDATPEHIAFFREHGYLVLDDVIPLDDLDELTERCRPLVEKRESLSYDWAWDERESKDERSFKIVQSSPAIVWPEIAEAPHHRWAMAFAARLMDDRPMEILLDMFLGKPPTGVHGREGEASKKVVRSVPTYWHQDEAYWGRNLDDRGITCWIPLQDTDAVNGCMHFIDGGHLDGVQHHHLVEGVQSDLLSCDVDSSRQVVCAVRRGGVTFHHSKTPHMTTANTSDEWRNVVTQHMQVVGSGGEGGHYPWKVYVNQMTGERTIPERR